MAQDGLGDATQPETIQSHTGISRGELTERDRQDLAFERIRLWQGALHYYDQRRLTVVLYATTINAFLVWYSHQVADQMLLGCLLTLCSAGKDDIYLLGVLVFSVAFIVSLFSAVVTYGYTDGCYRINADILNVQREWLPSDFVSSGRGRHGMHGWPITSYYVLFPILLSVASVFGLARSLFLYFS